MKKPTKKIPESHGSFRNNAPKPGGVKKEWVSPPGLAGGAVREGSTKRDCAPASKHHASVEHPNAGAGRLKATKLNAGKRAED